MEYLTKQASKTALLAFGASTLFKLIRRQHQIYRIVATANLENAYLGLSVQKDRHDRFHAAPVPIKKVVEKLVVFSVRPVNFVLKAQVITLAPLITQLLNVETVLLVTTAPQERSRHTIIHAEKERTQTSLCPRQSTKMHAKLVMQDHTAAKKDFSLLQDCVLLAFTVRKARPKQQRRNVEVATIVQKDLKHRRHVRLENTVQALQCPIYRTMM